MGEEEGLSDKLAHGYGQAYQEIAARDPWSVVEVGAGSGAGLRWFRTVFPSAELLGVDIDAERVAHCRGQGFDVILSDQAHPSLPAEIIRRVGPPGLIVDDASHGYRLTMATLRLLWPILAPGGTYVIEDWSHVDQVDVARYRAFIGHLAHRVTADPRGLIIFRKAF